MKVSKESFGKIIEELKLKYDSMNKDDLLDFSSLTIFPKPKEEKFILPDKWAIKAYNKENARIIYPYLNNTYGHHWDIHNYSHHNLYWLYGGYKDDDCVEELPEEYTELTIEQFRKYIIDANTDENALDSW